MVEDKDQTTSRDIRAQAWGALEASIIGVTVGLGLSGVVAIAIGRGVLARGHADDKSQRLARIAILLGWVGIALALVAIAYFLIRRML